MTKEQTSAGSLRDRLAAASSRRFVGRRAEVEAYHRLLAEPDATTSLLWVHGPGGVGKSTLLRHFAQVARGRGLRVLEVDARDVAPTPEGIGAALRVAMDTQERQVICLDTYCHGGGWLTGLEVGSGQIWQADREGRLREPP